MDREVKYFAYGSNLNISQMISRIGTWKTAKRAFLKGWKLTFDKYASTWRGNAANIKKTIDLDDKVFGVVYILSKEKFEVLKTYEGGYKPIPIKIESEGKVVEAITFVTTEGEAKKPPKKYILIIEEGLIQHGYNKELVTEYLQSWKD